MSKQQEQFTTVDMLRAYHEGWENALACVRAANDELFAKLLESLKAMEKETADEWAGQVMAKVMERGDSK